MPGNRGDVSPPDEDIVRRILNGESALFEVIVRRYYRWLWRASLSVIGDAVEAEDVVQDTYLQAWKHLKEFAGDAKLSSWLMRIALHEAFARARRNRRKLQPDFDQWLDSAPRLPSIERNPETQAQDRETRALLFSTINTLPAMYRSVFVLREIEGLPTAEVAERLGISKQTVKIRLHRSCRMLRIELGPHMRASAAGRAAGGVKYIRNLTPRAPNENHYGPHDHE